MATLYRVYVQVEGEAEEPYFIFQHSLREKALAAVRARALWYRDCGYEVKKVRSKRNSQRWTAYTVYAEGVLVRRLTFGCYEEPAPVSTSSGMRQCGRYSAVSTAQNAASSVAAESGGTGPHRPQRYTNWRGEVGSHKEFNDYGGKTDWHRGNDPFEGII